MNKPYIKIQRTFVELIAFKFFKKTLSSYLV